MSKNHEERRSWVWNLAGFEKMASKTRDSTDKAVR